MTSTSSVGSSKLRLAPTQVPSTIEQVMFLGGYPMSTMHSRNYAGGAADPVYPLYDPRWEHDACGTGFLAQISGDASHTLIQTALQALANLTHRGAQDADAETSDGAGLLTQIPKTLLCEELLAQQITPPNPEDLAVGMIFLPSQDRSPAAYL